jgi:predicted nuclease of predicted toxin-antitoxin system
MKLLLDENLSRRLVPFLQHDFPDSSQVVLLGVESASDKEVWQKAKDEGYVIVTRDADFQELSLVWGQPSMVIRLKTLNQSRAATSTRHEPQHHATHHTDLQRADPRHKTFIR